MNYCNQRIHVIAKNKKNFENKLSAEICDALPPFTVGENIVGFSLNSILRETPFEILSFKLHKKETLILVGNKSLSRSNFQVVMF